MAPDFFARLTAPFDPARVSWRVGSTTERDGKMRGMALAYIDARDVMDRLDEVCGPAGWQCDYPHANGKTVCRIGILCGFGLTAPHGEWVWKADGAGDTDFEAEKGALSDAFKRAAVRWGIGRYLYDVEAPWVECEKRGKTAIIAPSETGKLRALLGRVKVATRAPVAPALEEAPDSKALFIKAAQDLIRRSTDKATLSAWWRSEDQQQQRRAFGLTDDEKAILIRLITERGDALDAMAREAA